MDSHALVWPLELGIRSPTPWRGLSKGRKSQPYRQYIMQTWAFQIALVKGFPNIPTGGAPGKDPTPKGGGGGGALRTPKLSHGTMCFVGAGDFVLGIRQGEFFLFHPMCLYSKYSEFCGEFKNG